MLNALWAFMMLTGLGWAAVHGTLGAVTEGMLAAAGDAVSLGITMLGVMAFWTGILEIGRRAGLIEQLSVGMRRGLTTFSSSMTAFVMSSHRPKLTPPWSPASMKLSCGRV